MSSLRQYIGLPTKNYVLGGGKERLRLTGRPFEFELVAAGLLREGLRVAEALGPSVLWTSHKRSALGEGKTNDERSRANTP